MTDLFATPAWSAGQAVPLPGAAPYGGQKLKMVAPVDRVPVEISRSQIRQLL